MIYNKIRIIKEPAVEVKTPVGYLYRIVNNVNGKTYVGRRNLSYDKSWRQYMGSGQLIKNAISKYGAEHFTKEFLGYYYTSDDLSVAEDKLITSEWGRGKCEYNLKLTPPPETVRILSEEKQKDRSKKISNALKQRHKDNPDSGYFYQRSQQLKSEYKLFVNNYGNKIIELFDKDPNATKIAKELEVSRKWTTRFLKENNYQLQSRDKHGYSATSESRIYCITSLYTQ